MPNEESRLKRDDPLTTIMAQTDSSEVRFFPLFEVYFCSHYEVMGESHRAAPTRNDADINKPIWFHARKVNHRSNLLNKTGYGAV